LRSSSSDQVKLRHFVYHATNLALASGLEVTDEFLLCSPTISCKEHFYACVKSMLYIGGIARKVVV